MDVTQKNAERLYIGKNTKELIARIDELKYFGLHNSATSRTELFSFAMAIGIEAVPTTLQGAESFVREETIDPTTKALIYAFYIKNELSNGNLDAIEETSTVFSIAQKYANTGFGILETYVNSKKEMDLVWELFTELDDQYKTIVSSSS